jgi:hypothetical protein
VRHQDNRAPPGASPYDLWIADDGRLHTYQCIQRRPVYAESEWVISFVATPLDETLFTGIHRVQGYGTAQAGMLCPVTGHDVAGLILYDLCSHEALQEYVGRIVIDWGSGYRSWVQRADRQDKPVIEIRRQAHEPPFPGFTAFSWPIRELSSVPASWRGALSALSGVYVLVCRSTGKQYIGSAYGSGGFWSRWENYFHSGHGGNKGMKLLTQNDYQVSILEFASPTMTLEEVIRMEARWKDKLLTRRFGLNQN